MASTQEGLEINAERLAGCGGNLADLTRMQLRSAESFGGLLRPLDKPAPAAATRERYRQGARVGPGKAERDLYWSTTMMRSRERVLPF